MPNTLLAHLYPRVKGSQEDIATFSLEYILHQSSVLNDAFTELISTRLGIKPKTGIVYNCQDSDSKYGRPDIAGYDKGELKLLCEAKFYAGLTENQPVSYLKRLLDKKEVGLIFVCPKSRIILLWDKLKSISSEAGFVWEEISEFSVKNNELHFGIISWDELLLELIRKAEAQSPETLGDLRQLEEFCKQIDNESFRPFKPEEISAQTARDIDRYFLVVDKVRELLLTKKDLNPSINKLHKTPNVDGYAGYMRFGNIGVSINFDRYLWKKPESVETPFWFYFQKVFGKDWIITDELKQFYASIDTTKREVKGKDIFVALIPKPFATLEEVAEDIANQIIEYYNLIKGL